MRLAVIAVIGWLSWELVAPPSKAPESTPHAWGWDESMHAQLPAIQMLLHAERGEWSSVFDVLHSCERYPFGYPVALALWQSVFGIGQTVARNLGLVCLLLIALGTARLAQRLLRQAVPVVGRPAGLAVDAGLFAAALILASPLARRYAPTLFLEVPTLLTIVATLNLWLTRRRFSLLTRKRAWVDLACGMCVAAVFFTKFNYAILLLGALLLDGVVEVIRNRHRRGEAVSLFRVWLPLMIALVWWFVLPLPLGADVAARHRAAFMEFITGNQELKMAGWLRAINWMTGVTAHSLMLPALTLVSLVFIVVRRSAATLTMGLTLFAFVAPILAHEFQLDRFLLPAALALAVLAGAGSAYWWHRHPRSFAASLLAVVVACASIPRFNAILWIDFPVAEPGSEVRAFQEFHISSTLGIFGPPASNGLTRDVHEELLDIIANAVGTDRSVGWLGQSSEISPASLHLGLLERGGSKERFLRYAGGPMDIVAIPSDRHIKFTSDELHEFVGRFDDVIVPSTGDLMQRPSRSWVLSDWYQPLRDSGETEWTTLESILVDRAQRGPMPVTFELVRLKARQ